MAELTRAHDWAETPVGPTDTWSETLLCAVNVMLGCQFPCVVFWGEAMTQFYNDAYLPLMTEKHPAALGQDARDCWREAWHIIGPQFEATLREGKTTFQENVLVPVLRGSQLQDVFWTYSYSPISTPDGAVAGIMIVCQDTTGTILASREQKRAEAALEQERAQLDELVQQAPAFMAMMRGPSHIFERCNAPYQRLVGNRELLGRPVVEVLPEVEEQGYVALLDEVYRTGEPFVAHGARIVFASSNGQAPEDRYVDFVYQARRDGDGVISGVIALGVDVTERRQAEKVLLQTEKLAALGRLASSIAHEINNPLESVTNLLYLVHTHSGLPPEVAEYVDTAERELRRVSVITNQTLSFYRQSAHMKAVRCEDLFDGVLSIYQGRLINSNIDVKKRKRASQPVMCFEGEIRQVLSNLIGNAIDAMLARGGRLQLRSRDTTCWSPHGKELSNGAASSNRNGSSNLEGSSQRKGLVLTVADEGGGISGANVSRIFEPFFSTKGNAGNGLGLWISKEIVERHRGAIQVRSRQTRGRSGTVFTVFLPYAVADHGGATPANRAKKSLTPAA